MLARFAITAWLLGCAVACHSKGAKTLDFAGIADSFANTVYGDLTAADSLADSLDTDDAPDTPADSSTKPDSEDASPAQPWTTCPPDSTPFPYDALCKGSLSCDYGQECCCGQCSAATHCTCTGGHFLCTANDICMGPPCSPGCSFGKYQTPSGCAYCAEIDSLLPAAVASILAPLDACGEDSDCTMVVLPKVCGSACPTALPAAATASAIGQVGVLATQWCGTNFGSCVTPCAAKATDEPLCIQGHCQLVGLCDAKVAPQGTHCDDDNACTIDDSCQGPGLCAGMPVNCDDGNPCTLDVCNPLSGCQHTDSSGACASSQPCGFGLCVAGKCKDSEVNGWIHDLAGKVSPAGALARVDTGGFVLAVGDPAGHPRVVRLSEGGTVTWDVAAVPVQYAVPRDVVALAGGGILVSGSVVAFEGGAFLTRLGAQGQTVWATLVPMPAPNGVHVAVRPEGGFALAGINKPKPNEWHAWVARLADDGTLLGQTDLGKASGTGNRALVAARSGAIGVLTSVPGIADAKVGEQDDVRFVRTDATGKVLADVVILPNATHEAASGLVALPTGGWLVAVAGLSYGKVSKSLIGRVLRVDDQGAVVWKQELTDVPLVAVADGTNLLVWTVEASGSMQSIRHAQTWTADGQMTTDLIVPANAIDNVNYEWLAADGAGGILVAGQVPKSGTVRLMRVLGPGVSCSP